MGALRDHIEIEIEVIECLLRLVPATDTFIMLVMVFSPIGLVRTRCLNLRFRLLLR